MATAPQYVSTQFPLTSFNPGGVLPTVPLAGIYVTDQPTLDAITASARTSGVALVVGSTPPTGYQGGSAAYAGSPVLLNKAGKIDQGLLPNLASYIRRTGGRLLHEQTVSTDITSVATSSAPLAGATQPLIFAPNNVMDPVAYGSVDWGQGQINGAPFVYPQSPNGWVGHNQPWAFQQMKSLRFWTDARYLSVANYFGIECGAKIFIDGKPALANNITTTGNAPANLYLNLTFPSNKARLIEIQSDNFYVSLTTDPFARIWAPPPFTGPRMLCAGDSFTHGFYATGGNGAYQQLGELLNIPNLAMDGQGGAGYLSVGTYNNGQGGGSYNDPVRHANHIAWKPDIVQMGGSLNDFNTPYTQAQIQAAMVQKFSNLRAALPNALLIFTKNILSPYFKTAQGGTIGASCATLNAAIDGGLLAPYGVKVIDPSAALTGTGYQGATTGDGNSDRYVFTDKAHPNDAGSQYLATILAELIAPLLVQAAA